MLRKILTHCVSDFKLSHGLLTHSINRQDYRYCSKLTEDQNSAKDRLGEEMDKVPTENSLEYDDKSLKGKTDNISLSLLCRKNVTHVIKAV